MVGGLEVELSAHSEGGLEWRLEGNSALGCVGGWVEKEEAMGRKAGVLALFDVDGTLTPPRKVRSLFSNSFGGFHLWFFRYRIWRMLYMCS